MSDRKLHLHLNTDDSLNPTSPDDSHFLINIRNNELDVRNLSLSEVNFSNTVYPINNNYNKLYLQEDSATGSTFTATLVVGYYTGTSFAAELKAALDASSGANTYAVAYSSTTKKITITTSGTNLAFVAGDNNAYREAGVSTSELGTFASSYVPTNPVYLSGSQYVDIMSNLISNDLVVSSNDRKNTLVRIPLEHGFGGIVYYNAKYQQPININSVALRDLSLRMIDDRQNSWALPSNSPVSYSFILGAQFK